jgi:hypothetical protein
MVALTINAVAHWRPREFGFMAVNDHDRSRVADYSHARRGRARKKQ